MVNAVADQQRFSFSLNPGEEGQQAVPAAAFRVSLGNCQFKVGDDEKGDLSVRLFARSMEPVRHWYWGDMYHDFAGMVHNETIAVDYCHDDDEILGVGHKFTVDAEGLWIDSKLSQQHDGDRVSILRKHAQLSPPVPYEASIDFRGDILAQEVPEGYTAEVNGQSIIGPALIFREWPLRRVAICPSGRDSNTHAQFTSSNADPVTIRLFSEEGNSVKTKTKGGEQTVPATQTEAPEGTPTVDQKQTESTPAKKPEQQQAEQPAGDATNGDALRKQFAADRERFVGRFGAELGNQFLANGTTYSAACEKFIDHQAKQLSEKDAEIGKLTEKLNGLHTGEESPAKLGEVEGADTASGKFAHLGKVGGFASSIKLPGQSAN